MSAQSDSMASAHSSGPVKTNSRYLYYAALAIVAAALAVIYARTAHELVVNWTLADSYYTHGFLVPVVSLFFVWRQRAVLANTPLTPSAWGLMWVFAASLMLLIGDFLGFRVFGHLSIVPMIAGLIIVFAGSTFALRLWFPILFLLFMIPIPPSLTQSIALQLKLFAAESAVRITHLLTLPMVREGSYIYFQHGNVTDRLLVGDICGGLRSLIALLAIGAVAAYISPTKNWARVFILLLAGPIAVVSNIVRIFFLCVVGYFYGSAIAGGKVHDYSGFLIYAVAIALFTAVDIPFRRWFSVSETSDRTPKPVARLPLVLRAGTAFITIVVLCVVALLHAQIVRAQSLAHMEASAPMQLDIPREIADYRAIKDHEIDPRTRELLETSAILIREYAAPGGKHVQLSIVHAGSTRRSLHFPEVCLVGDGWEIVKQQQSPVGILFTAKRLVLVKGEQSEAILYWFKTGEHVTGDFFRNALEWTKNQITFGEPTSAMIKLATPIGPAGEREAFSTLEDFATKFAPVMFENIK